MSPVINIENLYKEYRLGTIGYGTLREDMGSWWAKIKGRPDPNSIIGQSNEKNISSTDHILALNNINLEVKQGERLGIIGNNGAGKTTLLKILAQIASPTQGTVMTKGKIASLIAVGTGFHPELTGRENVYLNGSILGLTKKQIDSRYNEIVEFSGVEKFIDTPVKRYSSGMSIRLGFAVAAHLDPDILVVDEVLAVGDAEFRKKALEKMKPDGISESKTILFVSHNMNAIENLCSRTILLKDGKIVDDGSPKDVVNNYLQGSQKSPLVCHWENNDNDNNEYIYLQSVDLIDKDKKQTNQIQSHKEVGVQMRFNIKSNKKLIIPELTISNAVGDSLFSTYDKNISHDNLISSGQYTSIVWLPKNLFSIGEFSVTVIFFSPAPNTSERLIQKNHLLRFKVYDENSLQNSIGIIKDGNWSGIQPKLKWSFSDKINN